MWHVFSTTTFNCNTQGFLFCMGYIAEEFLSFFCCIGWLLIISVYCTGRNSWWNLASLMINKVMLSSLFNLTTNLCTSSSHSTFTEPKFSASVIQDVRGLLLQWVYLSDSTCMWFYICKKCYGSPVAFKHWPSVKL